MSQDDQTPPSDPDDQETETAPTPSRAHGRIGPYTILEKIGEGGMGIVYVAEQTEPVRRRVALKVIKHGMDSTQVIARFEAERQALALMDHPAIAKIYDAGTTADGRPYFAMEYVKGVSITEHCDREKLTNRARLELFIQVCEGVQHAHQKAVIHRDLKPSNVLVCILDGRAAVKIIDFGVAKAVAHRLTERTLYTEFGVMIGTPEYISPEQAEMTGQDVDTRSDVYSVGVMLYELLVGALPFEPKELRQAGFDEIRRKIREEVPPRPSARLSTLGDRSTESAQRRRTEPKALRRELLGDLDWITMKALEKDRARRYDSASALAGDVRRYLNHEPVLARPPSFRYRAGKFVRRNRVPVIAASVVALLLIALAVSMTLQTIRIARERDRANREAAAAKSVSEFLTGLFKVSDPSEARGNSITARHILDQGVKQIDTGLSDQPEVRARLMGTMGEVYWSLGLYKEAGPLLERALETRRRMLGPDHPDTLRSMYLVAKNLNDEGQYAEAEKRFHAVLELQRHVLGPEHPDTVTTMIAIATTVYGEGRYPEAERLFRELLDAQRRALAPDDPRALRSMNNLAMIVASQGRHAEAERLYRDTLELEQRALGSDHPLTLESMGHLALALANEHKYADAEQLLRTTLDIQRRVLGPEHMDTLESMHSLAMVLREDGHLPEAEKLQRETLAIQERTLGADHRSTLRSMGDFAVTLDMLHHYPEAADLYRKAIDIQRRVLGPDHPETAGTKYDLACNAALSGHRDEALAILRDALDHGLSASTASGLEQDEDFRPLHGDPRFEALVREGKHRGTAPQTR